MTGAKRRSKQAARALGYVLGAAVLYVTLAWSVFLWRHPEMTEREAMQRHFGDVLLWREAR